MINPLLSRRRLLMLGGAATLLAGSGVPKLATFADLAAQARDAGPRPLPIPKLETGEVKDGVRVFRLAIRRARHMFIPGVQTPTIGINAPYLGPTLRLREGETVRFEVKNELGEITTLHWHGMHLPARADGGPHQEIAPGQTWTPQFTVRQPAAFLWYHAHTHKRTGPHVWQGMAGPIIIEDERSDALPLPRDHGVDDVPLVLQDRLFDSAGQLAYIQSMHDVMMGMEGDVPICNGVMTPTFEARRSRLRLRILNGANAAFYNIGFSDGRPFQVIATDGGLLPAPVMRRRLLLTPGERAEIIVEVGDRPFSLVSGGPAASAPSGGMMGGGMMGGMMGRGMMGGMMNRNADLPPHTFLRIIPAPVVEKSPPVPARLATLPAPDPARADRIRTFVLQMGMGPMMMMGRRTPFAINGKAMDMAVINERVPVNSTEIWQIRNASPMPHPFHIHDVQFRVLDRNGRPPQPHEAGRKDTVLVNGGETVRVIMRFADYRDEKHPYMYHCHILEHEDAGMMGQFVVV